MAKKTLILGLRFCPGLTLNMLKCAGGLGGVAPKVTGLGE